MGITFLTRRRRHLPPPHTNFEKLQDILRKRKGLTLDVSSSGALAASLDKCVVSNRGSGSFSDASDHPCRILMNQPLIPLCGSWQQDACCQRSIFVLVVFLGIHSVTMVSPAPSTLTSPVRSDDTLVSPSAQSQKI